MYPCDNDVTFVPHDPTVGLYGRRKLKSSQKLRQCDVEMTMVVDVASAYAYYYGSVIANSVDASCQHFSLILTPDS